MTTLKLLLKTVTLFAFLFLPITSGWAAAPFNDIANRPANIGPGVVIQTENNGFWKIVEGSYYAGTQRSEAVYVHADGTGTQLSFLNSGVTFHVDKVVPIKTDTISRPANMNPGTVLQASSGDVWKITQGSYYGGSSSSELAIIYMRAGVTSISFSKTGVVMDVELLSAAPPPDCAIGKYDPATNKVSIPCLEVPGSSGTVVFKTEWILHSDTDGVLTLKLQKAEVK